MRFFTISILSALAALVSAGTTPNYSQGPSGNPIALPGLGDQIPVGEPYQVKWQPTTPGQVSIWLLRGPSNNVQPIDTIASSIDNSGEYTWTPATTLQNDVTHYGLIIIVEGTGQYQYSTQFGIKNAAVAGSSSAVVAASSSAVPSSAVASSSLLVSITATPSDPVEVKTSTAEETTSTATSTATPAVSSASSIVTVPVSVPTVTPVQTPSTPTTFASSTSTPSSTPSPTPSFISSSGADRKTAGFGAVVVGALVAVFAI